MTSWNIADMVHPKMGFLEHIDIDDHLADPDDDTVAAGVESLPLFVQVFRRELIAKQLSYITDNLKALRTEVRKLSARQGRTVAIQTLKGENLSLKQAILANLEDDGECFTCTFYECNLGASGNTEFEAIDNLKDIVEATYRRLSAAKAAKLGPMPTKQISVLRQFIAE